jgi:predicted enzyme related to lactoylglutathione lyase
MAAPVVWFEVAGQNLKTLTSFYSKLFGWKVDADNPMGYGMVDTGGTGGIPGGVFEAPEGVGDYVTFYAEVPDLDAALVRAEEVGGKVVQPRTPLDNGPIIAMILDPEGHRIGVLQQP